LFLLALTALAMQSTKDTLEWQRGFIDLKVAWYDHLGSFVRLVCEEVLTLGRATPLGIGKRKTGSCPLQTFEQCVYICSCDRNRITLSTKIEQ
jgi:hypothetical protein